MEKRDCQINVRIPCRLKEQLTQLAQAEQRKVSDLVVLILENHAQSAKPAGSPRKER